MEKAQRQFGGNGSDLNGYTREIWQPLADRDLTDEDARQMLENVLGFFRLLDRWDREEKDQPACFARAKGEVAGFSNEK